MLACMFLDTIHLTGPQRKDQDWEIKADQYTNPIQVQNCPKDKRVQSRVPRDSAVKSLQVPLVWSSEL